MSLCPAFAMYPCRRATQRSMVKQRYVMAGSQAASDPGAVLVLGWVHHDLVMSRG